jgi:uncharacterized membrane protein YcfT
MVQKIIAQQKETYMECLPNNQATRRYNKRYLIATPLYIILLFVAVHILRHDHPSHTLAIVIAILPSIPLVAMIAIAGLYLKEERDEFMRSIFQQSLLWSIGLVLAITSIWGLLEMIVGVPHLPIFYVFPGFCLFFGICSPLLKRRYR